MQYAVNGNFCDGDGRFDEAVVRHEKAVAALSGAVSKGFSNLGWLNAEPWLEPLRKDDRWKQII